MHVSNEPMRELEPAWLVRVLIAIGIACNMAAMLVAILSLGPELMFGIARARLPMLLEGSLAFLVVLGSLVFFALRCRTKTQLARRVLLASAAFLVAIYAT
jgi:hypothetical protein